ncbi:MAG TPA: SemiSWEET transporter [Acidobacteriaceae bacterium]|nr:SemiSWEET transporter [Acidobacteriaceae bacterium]
MILPPQTAPAISIENLGFAAAFCTTVAFIPQLVRVVRRRSAKDVSLPTFLLFSIGVFMWLIYGIDIGSRPVIASNSVTLVLALSIVVLKLRYDREATEELKPHHKEPKP